MSRRHPTRATTTAAAITTSTTDAGPTPTDLTRSIRDSITTLRKAWPHLEDPPAPIGTTRRPAPTSKPPTPITPLSLREEIGRDLAYWCHELLEDHPEGRSTDHPLDLTDPGQMLDHLHTEAVWAGGWSYGNRLACELEDHARDAHALAWPRSADGILLGECPVTIGADGEPVDCGGKVRAKPDRNGDIRCPRCKTRDTIDGWLLRIVGTNRPVTIPQLVPILRGRLGIRVDERTLQRWHRAGRITPTAGTDGKPLFDRRHVLAIVLAHEEAKGGRRTG